VQLSRAEIETLLALGVIDERLARDLEAILAWNESGIPYDALPRRPDGSIMTPDEWRAEMREWLRRT
jgi:hypothetical protein